MLSACPIHLPALSQDWPRGLRPAAGRRAQPVARGSRAAGSPLCLGGDSHQRGTATSPSCRPSARPLAPQQPLSGWPTAFSFHYFWGQRCGKI